MQTSKSHEKYKGKLQHDFRKGCPMNEKLVILPKEVPDDTKSYNGISVRV